MEPIVQEALPGVYVLAFRNESGNWVAADARKKSYVTAASLEELIKYKEVKTYTRKDNAQRRLHTLRTRSSR